MAKHKYMKYSGDRSWQSEMGFHKQWPSTVTMSRYVSMPSSSLFISSSALGSWEVPSPASRHEHPVLLTSQAFSSLPGPSLSLWHLSRNPLFIGVQEIPMDHQATFSPVNCQMTFLCFNKSLMDVNGLNMKLRVSGSLERKQNNANEIFSFS